jgi:FtsZ-binding cell division protein ZapB
MKAMDSNSALLLLDIAGAKRCLEEARSTYKSERQAQLQRESHARRHDQVRHERTVHQVTMKSLPHVLSI